MRIERPNRATRTYVQTLEAPPERVFPLYCPVREADWVEGWDPVAVYTESGLVEEECVFVTRDAATGRDSSWVVTEHDPERYRVAMVKCTPGVTMCVLRIRLAPAGEGRTSAEITYSHTSLGPEGDRLVESFTEDFYAGFMRRWEEAMSRYLAAGGVPAGGRDGP